MKQIPTFDLENEIGAKIIAGVDEAGRGPLCGPVVAAAVVIPAQAGTPCIPNDITIRDSKQMTGPQRVAAAKWIKENCIWAVGQCSAAEIDELNILHASMLAMRRAIDALAIPPDFVLVDGNRLPDGIFPANGGVPEGRGGLPGRAVIRGDAKSLSIAAASIIAKETRDEIMRGLAAEFPQYDWDKNAGYPTKSHLIAIKKYGINDHYRKTYKPVRELL